MRQDVQRYTQGCHACQKARVSQTPKGVKPKPITRAGESWQVDVMYIPNPQLLRPANVPVLVAVDECSALTVVQRMRSASAQHAREAFLAFVDEQEYIQRITLDGGSEFRGRFEDELNQQAGPEIDFTDQFREALAGRNITLNRSAPHYPAAHGLVERMIRELRVIIAKTLQSEQFDTPFIQPPLAETAQGKRKWELDYLLDSAVEAINNRPNRMRDGLTPRQIYMGEEPIAHTLEVDLGASTLNGPILHYPATAQQQEQYEQRAVDALRRSRAKMAADENARRRPKERRFQVGAKVMVAYQSKKDLKTYNVGHRHEGPYTVVAVLEGGRSLELEAGTGPADERIHLPKVSVENVRMWHDLPGLMPVSPDLQALVKIQRFALAEHPTGTKKFSGFSAKSRAALERAERRRLQQAHRGQR